MEQNSIEEHIKSELNRLESELGIHILLACETGSRAWGFPSPDSDYDIRILYVHKSDWYLSVFDKKDSLEIMLDDGDLDITGWELRKSLTLLKRSNAALLERIQSPIKYKHAPDFLEDFTAAANQCYSRIATMHHYLSMAQNIRAGIQPDKPYKLKKLFYVLRCATICRWIIDRAEMPHIEFSKVYQDLDLPEDLIKQIDLLIELKSTKSEAYNHTGEREIFEFIDQCINYGLKHKENLPVGVCNSAELDQIMRKYVRKYDY